MRNNSRKLSPLDSADQSDQNSMHRRNADLVGPWFQLPVHQFQLYIASYPHFWVYGNLGFLTWITGELRADDRS